MKFDYEAVFKTEIFVGLLERDFCEGVGMPNVGTKATLTTNFTVNKASTMLDEKQLKEIAQTIQEKIKNAFADDKKMTVGETFFSHYTYVRQDLSDLPGCTADCEHGDCANCEHFKSIDRKMNEE